MNGQVSKRIRIAARIISGPDTYRGTVQRLKKEYKAEPYHKREKTRHFEGTSHSAVLKNRLAFI